VLYDVAILGGGPAGSTAGTLLAQRGRSVIVLEREKFPRFHIGESLLPFSMAALDRLGVRSKLDAAGFLPKYGAEVLSGCGEREVRFLFRNGFQPQCETAYQVTRSEFDKILLDHSSESGVEVREETLVRSVDFQREHVELETRSPRGTETIRARYVIDASGRHSVIGTQLGLRRTYPHLRKFAVYAHYDGVNQPCGEEGTLTRMVRESDRWFWMIPLSRTRMSIGVVMDTDAYKQMKGSPEEILDRAIERQPRVGDRLRGSCRVTEVRASGDYSYRNRSLHGPRWLLAGDAAGFIDPIFSSGVFIAILSGEQAADALDQTLNDPRQARRIFPAYAKRLHTVMDLYLEFVSGWYTQPFIETLLNPREFLKVVPAVNAVLAGNPGTQFGLRWRLAVFHALVRLQRRFALSPRLSLQPA